MTWRALRFLTQEDADGAASSSSPQSAVRFGFFANNAARARDFQDRARRVTGGGTSNKRYEETGVARRGKSKRRDVLCKIQASNHVGALLLRARCAASVGFSIYLWSRLGWSLGRRPAEV
jgi:hypothetical protein